MLQDKTTRTIFQVVFLPEKAYNDPETSKKMLLHAQFCAPCSYNAKGKLMPYYNRVKTWYESEVLLAMVS
jgi:hypothetical protein